MRGDPGECHELIRPVNGRRVKVNCEKWREEGKSEGSLRSKHGGYKDLPHRLWLSAREEAGLIVMATSLATRSVEVATVSASH